MNEDDSNVDFWRQKDVRKRSSLRSQCCHKKETSGYGIFAGLF